MERIVVKEYDHKAALNAMKLGNSKQFNDNKSQFDPTKVADKEMVEKAEKYVRVPEGMVKVKKDAKLKRKLIKNEREAKDAAILAAKTEFLLPEQVGYLEGEGIERTFKFTQENIKPHLSISAQSKIFDLSLDKLGPYNMDYTRNGKYILIGGRKGHVATFDWKSGMLGCELQLRETVRDVKWLHNETMFAVAQKKYVYIYDKNGLEIHCLKSHLDVTKLDFLPYHFLLTSIGNTGTLRYQDVSTGKLVANFRTGLGRTDIMTHNPQNAVVHLGHTDGSVSFWSPNSKNPLVKILTHKGPVQSVSVDHSGNYMATSGRDSKMKVWDLRQYKVVSEYFTPKLAQKVVFSQRGSLATSFNSHVSIWNDVCKVKQQAPYMNHQLDPNHVQDLMFCPYEDVLGIGHTGGFSSILVPGSGEPNFDSLEANPYQTTKQRHEHEVHTLLNKIQPDTIVLDSNVVGSVYNTANLEDDEEEQNTGSGKKVDIRYRARGKSSSSKRFTRKKGMAEMDAKKTRARTNLQAKNEEQDKLNKLNANQPIRAPKQRKVEPNSALDVLARKFKD